MWYIQDIISWRNRLLSKYKRRHYTSLPICWYWNKVICFSIQGKAIGNKYIEKKHKKWWNWVKIRSILRCDINCNFSYIIKMLMIKSMYNYIDIKSNCRFTVRFYCVSGWHGRQVGLMVSCLRFLMNNKNSTDKITREAGLTPREPSISYDVHDNSYFIYNI